jgi:hypothetical protein
MQVHRDQPRCFPNEHEIELMCECRNWLISDMITGKGDERSIEVPAIFGEELLALDEVHY